MSISKAIGSAILAVGGDPTDPMWEWLADMGPHGAEFSWSQTKTQPPGYVGVEHLERIVVERQSADPGFRMRAREVVRLALASNDVGLLRRGVQVAAVVGDKEELERIQNLISHQALTVAAHARASAFYLKGRLRRVGHDA